MFDGRLTYDTILKQKIQFGKWQLIALFHFFTCTALPYVLYPTFTFTINVPHRCAIPELDLSESLNLTYDQITKLAIPSKSKMSQPQIGYPYYPCKQYNTSWILQLLKSTNYNISYDQLAQYKTQLPGNDSVSEALTCQNGITYDTRLRQHQGTGRQHFGLVCEKNWLVTWSISAYMIGQLVSCLTASYLADRFGRRIILLLFTYLTYIFGIVTGFAPDIWTFIVLRTLLGYIAMAHWIVGWTLMTEITTNKPRNFIMAWLFICFALIYYGIYIGMAYLIGDWGWLHIALTCLSFPSILSYIFIPESPRWLLAKKRREEAITIINKAIIMNKTNAQHVNDNTIVSFGVDNLNDDQTDHTQTKADVEQSITTVLKELTSILHVRQLRVRTWVLLYIWTVMGLVYYGIMLLSVNLPGNPYFSVWILSMGAIPSSLFQAFLYVKFNRRLPFILCISMGAIFFVSVGIYQSFTSAGSFSVFIIIFTTLGKLSMDCASSMTYIWTPELYPTEIRSYAFGFLFAIQRLGSTLAPFMNQLGDLTWRPLPFILYGLFSFGIVALSFILPETKNKAMFDTIEEMKMKGNRNEIEMEIPDSESNTSK